MKHVFGIAVLAIVGLFYVLAMLPKPESPALLPEPSGFTEGPLAPFGLEWSMEAGAVRSRVPGWRGNFAESYGFHAGRFVADAPEGRIWFYGEDGGIKEFYLQSRKYRNADAKTVVALRIGELYTSLESHCGEPSAQAVSTNGKLFYSWENARCAVLLQRKPDDGGYRWVLQARPPNP